MILAVGLSTHSFVWVNLWQVGPVKYMEVINACKPNLWASLPDEVPAWVSEKRNRMSVSRTLQWLDHCLSLSTDMGCLGVVVGGSSVEQRTHSAQQTATRNVAGFSLGGFGLGEAAEDRGPLLEAVTVVLYPCYMIHLHFSGACFFLF